MYDNFDALSEDGKFKFWTGEISNDELGAWLRLLGMASRSAVKGVICIDGGIAYSPEQIKQVIKTDKNYIEKWEKQGAIKTIKGVIYIENWKYYQTEQERKDGYKKLNSPLNSPPKKTLKKPRIDVDVDVDLDVKEYNQSITDKKNKSVGIKPADPRVKVLIDYFFDKHLEIKKEKYVVTGGKDSDVLRKLLILFSETELKDKIDRFFAITDDPFIIKAGYTVGVFKSQINKLHTPAISEGEQKFRDMVKRAGVANK